jgi:hypothetical protein
MDGTSIPSAAVTVTISGSGSSTGLPKSIGELRHGPRPIFASILPFGLLGMVMVGRKRRTAIVLLLVLLGTVLFSVNCGSGSGSGSTSHTNLAPGTYQVTVTGASTGANALSHSSTVTLTVS